MFRVCRAVCFIVMLSLLVPLTGSMALGQERVVAKRTIVESLDDVVDKKARLAQAGKKNLDFSVTREVLPPIDGLADLGDQAEWVTVIDAGEITTGSIATADGSSMLRMVIGAVLVLIGSVLLFRRHLHPRFGIALADLGLRIPHGLERLSLSPVVARLSTLGDQITKRFSSSDDPEPTGQWDAETENASQQMRSLLNQIEKVVVRLKDGSPLRDVLNQELRLIHYRISAATEAARLGRESNAKSAARFRGLVRELERVRRIADSAAASVVDPHEHLALPQTPSEAYALLGVNHDVTPAVLKKLVDALRMTWHPDHARNESDRLLREERIKQINSAWDVINSGARAPTS